MAITAALALAAAALPGAALAKDAVTLDTGVTDANGGAVVVYQDSGPDKPKGDTSSEHCGLLAEAAQLEWDAALESWETGDIDRMWVNIALAESYEERAEEAGCKAE